MMHTKTKNVIDMQIVLTLGAQIIAVTFRVELSPAGLFAALLYLGH